MENEENSRRDVQCEKEKEAIMFGLNQTSWLLVKLLEQPIGDELSEVALLGYN